MTALQQTVTEIACRDRTDRILSELREIRTVVDNSQQERQRIWHSLAELNDRLLHDNGRKSVMTQIRELRDAVTVPKYATLPWLQLFKIVFVRSTWAVMLFLSAIGVTPAGQAILNSIARRWLP